MRKLLQEHAKKCSLVWAFEAEVIGPIKKKIGKLRDFKL